MAIVRYLLIPLLSLFISCGGSAVSNLISSNVATTKSPGLAGIDPTPTIAAFSLTKVSIDSADGLRLVGSMYGATKAKSPALLLLHQWESDRHSFDEFAARMQGKGFAVLSIDGRGFGKSTKKADGTTIAAGRSDADIKAMLDDVDAAFNFLSKQPNVDAKRVGIVGASYGSSLAIIYAADHPEVAAAALLSPGLNYFGNIPTKPAVEKFGERPLFMTAAYDDRDSADAVKLLREIQNRPFEEDKAPIYAGKEHGTALFKLRSPDMGGFNLEDKLEMFFRNAFQ